MPNTSEPAAIITRLLATRVPAPALFAAVAQAFPDLSPVELSAAPQEATAAAEKRIVSAKH
jgi:hypothetical protein